MKITQGYFSRLYKWNCIDFDVTSDSVNWKGEM